jgi:hypothetical protein
MDALQYIAPTNEESSFSADARANEDSGRCGKPQGAGASDDQDSDRQFEAENEG